MNSKSDQRNERTTNDVLGNSTAAATTHEVAEMMRRAGSPPPMTEAEILRLYDACSQIKTSDPDNHL